MQTDKKLQAHTAGFYDSVTICLSRQTQQYHLFRLFGHVISASAGFIHHLEGSAFRIQNKSSLKQKMQKRTQEVVEK